MVNNNRSVLNELANLNKQLDYLKKRARFNIAKLVKDQLNLLTTHDAMLKREQKMEALLTKRTSTEFTLHEQHISNFNSTIRYGMAMYRPHTAARFISMDEIDVSGNESKQLNLVFDKPKTFKQINIAWYRSLQGRRKKGKFNRYK